MIDRFDAGFDTPPQQPAQPARTYDLVPRGTCRVEIVKAERQAVRWRAEQQPGQGRAARGEAEPQRSAAVRGR